MASCETPSALSAEGAAGIRRVVRTGVCEALILMELDRYDERVAPVLESGLPFVTMVRT